MPDLCPRSDKDGDFGETGENFEGIHAISSDFARNSPKLREISPCEDRDDGSKPCPNAVGPEGPAGSRVLQGGVWCSRAVPDRERRVGGGPARGGERKVLGGGRVTRTSQLQPRVARGQ